jgi:hypothetical protein
MEEDKIELIISEYSQYPGPRYCYQGDSSGEDFYHKKLNKTFADAVLSKHKLFVILDGAAGYASSFLDEAFGNLIYDFSLEIVKKYLEIISNQEPDWKEMITKDIYSDWENRRKNGLSPSKTGEHPEWYRLVDKDIKKGIWK